MNTSNNVGEPDENKCQYIKNPFIGCYGTKCDSESSQKAVKYCLGDYFHCGIYIKHEKD